MLIGYGYSVHGEFRVRVKVRVWYYFIFCDWYMKYWPNFMRVAMQSFYVLIR